MSTVPTPGNDTRPAYCPDWCTLTHDEADDRSDGMALHMADDHTDGTVRRLLDAHRLEIQVARTDDLDEGRRGTASLYVRMEVELTTWEQAAELTRTILDGFGYLKGADLVESQAGPWGHPAAGSETAEERRRRLDAYLDEANRRLNG